MRILIIYRVDTSDKRNLGVTNKMYAQAKAFGEFGEVQIATLNGGKILVNNLPVKKYPNYTIAALKFFSVLKKQFPKDHFDLIYIRYGLSSPSFIQLLSYINGKIVLELPTYPYEKEFKGIINGCRLLVDRRYRKGLKTHVHNVTHLGSDKVIFGIPVIDFNNAIDTSSYKTSDKPFNRDKIILIAVGKWTLRHGLDRVITGLHAINNRAVSLPITLKIIGEGPEVNNLKGLVTSKDLNDKVKFYGIQEGKDLDLLFEDADIGVGILGFHRVGLSEISPLKHREYLVRGIPVLKSGKDQGIDADFEIINVDESDDPIDFDRIINLYQSMLDNGISKKEIHLKAIDKLDWKKQIKKIVNSAL